MSEAPNQPRPNFYRRITASVPLLVTVIVHVVLVAIAGYFVVSEQIIGKKKTFEAPPPSDNSVAQKQVQHRLQVARKGGGSVSSSPVSASRIFSTAENALQMPELPDLPNVRTISLGGMGFGAGMGDAGMGSGLTTGLNSGKSLGSGFMSLSFLGVTTQKAQKIVFVLDISKAMMDVRKDGFESFEIVRSRMMALVSRLPPSTDFGVVVFNRTDFYDEQTRLVRLFRPELVPATLANKNAFLEWMKPINSDPTLKKLAFASLPSSTEWKFTPAPSLGLDPDYRPTPWVNALHAAFEFKPDTVYVITAATSVGTVDASAATLAARQRERKELVDELKSEGIDLAEAEKAREAALRKARAELDVINQRQVAQGRPPFVIENTFRLFEPDFQAAIRKAGYTLNVDGEGWTRRNGQRIIGSTGHMARNWDTARFEDMRGHIAKLQAGLLRERAVLNIFYFVGSNQNTKREEEDLGKIARANGGKLELINAAKLRALKSAGSP